MSVVKTFYDPRKENGFLAIGYDHKFFCGTLSTMYGFNVYCASVEVATLALKFPHFAGPIIAAPNSAAARKIVNGQTSNVRITLETMLGLNLDKFANHDLNRMLMNTGSAELIKVSDVDVYWGINENGVGRNLLGGILMGVRDVFRGMSTREIVLAQIKN